jgi:hypothetical protein
MIKELRWGRRNYTPKSRWMEAVGAKTKGACAVSGIDPLCELDHERTTDRGSPRCGSAPHPTAAMHPGGNAHNEGVGFVQRTSQLVHRCWC